MEWDKKQLLLLHWIWLSIRKQEGAGGYYNGVSIDIRQVLKIINTDLHPLSDWENNNSAYPILINDPYTTGNLASDLNYANNALRLLRESGLVIYTANGINGFTVQLTANGYIKGKKLNTIYGRLTKNFDWTLIIAFFAFIVSVVSMYYTARTTNSDSPAPRVFLFQTLYNSEGHCPIGAFQENY